MHISYTNYIELPAPLSVIRALLLNPATPDVLPLPAERLDEMWRYGDELYTVAGPSPVAPSGNGTGPRAAQNSPAPLTLCWQVAPVAPDGPRLQIEITLYDAVVSTHARMGVVLLRGGYRWPWQPFVLRAKLARYLRACGEQMQAVVRQYSPVGADVPAPVPAGAAAASAVPIETPSPTLAERLRLRYPHTVASFEAMGALDHLERVWGLERGWEGILHGDYDHTVYETPTSPAGAAPPPLDYDLIYAGGGLGLLHAAVMAQIYGRRVLLFDRSEVGCVHREWNISRAELQALVDMGFVTWEELAGVMMREYERGLVKFFHSPGNRVPESELWFPDVLNVAIDAGGLLRLMRQKFERAGGTILDRHAFCAVRACEGQLPYVEVDLEALPTGEPATYRARLLVDGMGSTSPLALRRHAGKPFAGVCPTVGTVVSGLVSGSARDEFDPTVGDILISVADSQQGRQLIWEGFPGRGDELTVYVFYYAALKNAGRSFEPPLPPQPADDPQPRYSLLALFEQYFALLPSYKKPGPHFRHVKPVYGYIPGRHSVQWQDAPPLPGVLSVGDSSAQQSPLTYCGFGSHVRNLQRTTSLLEYALQHNLLAPQHMGQISAFQVNVSLNWVFSRFMHPWGTPQGVNEIQNAFLDALNALGPQVAARFFRDRMRWHDYNRIVWSSMLRYPDVFKLAFVVLGLPGVWQWLNDYLRFSAAAAVATAGRAAGPRGERLVCWLADRLGPAAGLRVRARYAEWRAMDWIESYADTD